MTRSENYELEMFGQLLEAFNGMRTDIDPGPDFFAGSECDSNLMISFVDVFSDTMSEGFIEIEDNGSALYKER